MPEWSPDDWDDHLTDLELLWSEVQEWERAQATGKGPIGDAVSEDVKYFEEQTLNDPSAVDGDDFTFRRVLQQKNKVPYRPPFGKTVVKQLFAGQMGLTMLCVVAGMSVAVPLDSSIAN